jgi:hypothetical protein
MSARRHFSHMSALFEARATKERVLHLRECAEYVFSLRTIFFETNIMPDLSYVFLLWIEWRFACPCDWESVNRMNSDLFSLFRNFRHPNWRNVVLDDFETLVRELDVRALVLQYHPESICTSAQTSISRTTMRSRNLILKVVSSKKLFLNQFGATKSTKKM